MWSNDTKCKYMFMFPLKNLARKGLTHCETNHYQNHWRPGFRTLICVTDGRIDWCNRALWQIEHRLSEYNACTYKAHGRGILHTQNTASAPSHPIQHPTAGMGTHMTPVGCVMAGYCQINYILTNIGRRNSIRILSQHPLFWNILIWTEFICFINLFAF